MKTKLLKLFVVGLALSVFGTGVAIAGGNKHYSTYSRNQSYAGSYHGGRAYHRPPPYHHRPYYWQHRPHHYGPPARYYNHRNYYYRGCERYDEGYYFSGAYAEPGFGFVFGTRGSW
jgi:hypothetical protein